MKNTLLDVVQSFESFLSSEDQKEVHKVQRTEAKGLTTGQFKNAFRALLNKYKNLKSSYEKLKTISNNKTILLSESISQLEEEKERLEKEKERLMSEIEIIKAVKERMKEAREMDSVVIPVILDNLPIGIKCSMRLLDWEKRGEELERMIEEVDKKANK